MGFHVLGHQKESSYQTLEKNGEQKHQLVHDALKKASMHSDLYFGWRTWMLCFQEMYTTGIECIHFQHQVFADKQ